MCECFLKCNKNLFKKKITNVQVRMGILAKAYVVKLTEKYTTCDQHKNGIYWYKTQSSIDGKNWAGQTTKWSYKKCW